MNTKKKTRKAAKTKGNEKVPDADGNPLAHKDVKCRIVPGSIIVWLDMKPSIK
jgi:hypothetical protein